MFPPLIATATACRGGHLRVGRGAGTGAGL